MPAPRAVLTTTKAVAHSLLLSMGLDHALIDLVVRTASRTATVLLEIVF